MFHKADRLKEQVADQVLFNDNSKQIEAEDAEQAMQAADERAGLTMQKAAANIQRNLRAQVGVTVVATIRKMPTMYGNKDIIEARVEERMQWAFLRCDFEVILFGTYSDLLRFTDSIPNYDMADPLGVHSYQMDGSPYFKDKMVSTVAIRVPRGAIDTLHKKSDLKAIAWYCQALDISGKPHGIITGNTEVMPVEANSIRQALLSVGW